MSKEKGFTLIELLVTVAIIGVLAAVAMPLYQGYLTSSRTKAAESNLQTLKLAEEAFYFDHNTYVAGTYDPAGGTDSLTAALSWTPDQDGKKYKYVVAAGGCGNIATCYTMTISYGGSTLATASR